MLFSEHLTVIRGGGDLATGVAYRLHKAGFPLIVTELPHPLVVRRAVALATAVLQGHTAVEDMHARHVPSVAQAYNLALDPTTSIPVLTMPDLAPLISEIQSLRSKYPERAESSRVPGPRSPVFCVVDARMAKRNIDTHLDQAPLVIALGPGFTAGEDCDAVIETMRGHHLGRVMWQGAAQANTGTPGIVAGKGKERVLRAPVEGVVDWRLEIGDLVKGGQVLGDVDGHEIRAPFDGVTRGLIAPGTYVSQKLKIGDVDARAEREACFQISDKALAIGGGVLEAMLSILNQSRP
jgi:xanthine dehydrogenase accessory factor